MRADADTFVPQSAAPAQSTEQSGGSDRRRDAPNPPPPTPETREGTAHRTRRRRGRGKTCARSVGRVGVGGDEDLDESSAAISDPNRKQRQQNPARRRRRGRRQAGNDVEGTADGDFGRSDDRFNLSGKDADEANDLTPRRARHGAGSGAARVEECEGQRRQRRRQPERQGGGIPSEGEGKIKHTVKQPRNEGGQGQQDHPNGQRRGRRQHQQGGGRSDRRRGRPQQQPSDHGCRRDKARGSSGNMAKNSNNDDDDETSEAFPRLPSDEAAFPSFSGGVAPGDAASPSGPSGSPGECTDASAPAPSSHWAGVAHRAQKKEDIREREERERALLEGGEGSRPKLHSLTSSMSTSGVRPADDGAVRADVEREADSKAEDVTLDVEPEKVSSGVGNSVPRLDLSRMRDRWWHILREKKIRDDEEAAAHRRVRLEMAQAAAAETDSDASGSSSSSVSTVSSTSSNDDSDSSGANHVPTKIPVKQGVPVVIQAVKRYLDTEYPLHFAIWKNDTAAVENLLKIPSKEIMAHATVDLSDLGIKRDSSVSLDGSNVRSFESCLTPLFLAVHLDSPVILKILLDSSMFSVDTTDASHRTPLMIAAGRGLDGCVNMLLSFKPSITVKDQGDGNTALHLCCGHSGQPSTLRLLLGAAGRGKGNAALQRLLCLLNGRSRTAMHVACSLGRTDLVEEMISTGGGAASSKAMRVEDADGRTPLLCAVAAGAADCATALLMWGGNKQMSVGRRSSSQRKAATKPPVVGPCPLTLAAAAGSADMVGLLLEFGDPNGSTAASSAFDLGAALVASLELDPLAHGADRLDVIRLLIEAGADPYAAVDGGRAEGSAISLGVEGEDDPPRTPLARAATMCGGDNAAGLRTILAAHAGALSSKRAARRSDPLLRRQPESYFKRLETAEDTVIAASMQDVLVRTLLLGWRDGCRRNNEPSTAYNGTESAQGSRLLASLALYRAGMRLSDSGLERLERSLAKKSLQGSRDLTCSPVRCFEAVYTHYGVAGYSNTKEKSLYKDDRSSVVGWSMALAGLDWMWHGTSVEGEVVCGWMRERLRSSSSDVNRECNLEKALKADECYLLVDGHRMLAHKSIISSKSAKLGAAVRFAALNRVNDDADGAEEDGAPLEILVNAPFHMMKLLLQHIYHGSIVAGLSWSNPSICCRQLFELAFLADEFVCPSLLNECEMRLLADRPDFCVCWCCCAATRCAREKQVGETSLSLGTHHGEGLGHPTTCLYRVVGPSHLITAETAIDVLAVAEEADTLGGENCNIIEHSTVDGAVGHLPMTEEHVFQEYDTRNQMTGRPFVSAKAVAVEALLRNFSAAMKSDSFLVQVQSAMADTGIIGTVEEGQHVATFLLEACLEDMASAPFQNLSPQMQTLPSDSHRAC